MIRATMAMMVMLSVLSSACRQEEKGPQMVPLEGKIEKIKISGDGTGEITVRFKDKQQQDTVGAGIVTSETEILINGAASKLADLREGERIRGDVRVEKKGEERKQIVVRISVDRSEPVKPGN